MKRLGIISMLCVVLGTGAGCGGPHYLTNSVSDWYAQKYHESPWIYGNVLSYALYGFVAGFAWMGDAVFVNTYYFWSQDAEPGGNGKGSTFDHQDAKPGKKIN